MKRKASTLTTGTVSGLKVGDIISIEVPQSDRRWHVQVWCWITRRPLPVRMVRREFKVTAEARG